MASGHTAGTVGHSVEIHFTVDDAGSADALVEALLSDRLVACGQRIGPVVSRYWWQGAIERAEEWLVLLKTRADLASRVIDAVVRLHPYETPEVVVVDIAGGAHGYLTWMADVTVGGSHKAPPSDSPTNGYRRPVRSGLSSDAGER